MQKKERMSVRVGKGRLGLRTVGGGLTGFGFAGDLHVLLRNEGDEREHYEDSIDNESNEFEKSQFRSPIGSTERSRQFRLMRYLLDPAVV